MSRTRAMADKAKPDQPVESPKFNNTALQLSTDQDTTITSDTDNRIDFAVNNTDVVRMHENVLEVLSQEDQATASTKLQITQTSTSVAVDDYLGSIEFLGTDGSTGSSTRVYANISSRIQNVTGNSEAATVTITTGSNSTIHGQVSFHPDHVALDTGQELQFHTRSTSRSATIKPHPQYTNSLLSGAAHKTFYLPWEMDGTSLTSSATLMTSVLDDLSPTLGGDLRINGKQIKTAVGTNGDIRINPDGTGRVVLKGLNYPTSDGAQDTVLKTDGSGNLSFQSVASLSNSGITQVQDDTAPTLGGTLDANGNSIDMGTNSLTDTNLGQFITAHGWGNHASAGYLTAHPTIPLTSTSTSNSGQNFIQNITIDSNGHVTAIGTATASGGGGGVSEALAIAYATAL
jgi:hypothetical protein